MSSNPNRHPSKAPPALTLRQEANALVCGTFRNGFLETLHAGKHSPLLEDPTLSRITDAEMKSLMIEASALLARLLAMKETHLEKYWENIRFFHGAYTHGWDQTEIAAETPVTELRSPLSEQA